MLEKEAIIRQRVLTRPGGKAGTGGTNQQETKKQEVTKKL